MKIIFIVLFMSGCVTPIGQMRTCKALCDVNGVKYYDALTEKCECYGPK